MRSRGSPRATCERSDRPHDVRQFFDEVAEPYAQQAIANRGDLRCAVNAIVTFDAVLEFMHAELRRRGTKGPPVRVDAWKEQLVNQDDDYRLLRDTAATFKHGELTDRKELPRHVRRPAQMRQTQGAFRAQW